MTQKLSSKPTINLNKKKIEVRSIILGKFNEKTTPNLNFTREKG
jgi:hypothetical protein